MRMIIELLGNPKKGRFLPRALSIEEMKVPFRPNLNTLEKRDRALFELMYGSGLRVQRYHP